MAGARRAVSARTDRQARPLRPQRDAAELPAVLLSSEKAWHSNCYEVPDGDTAYADGTRYLDPGFVLRELSHCLDEDQRIQQGLTPDDRVLTYDYTEIFPGNRSAISPEFLERFADWRGIDNTFTGKPGYRKLSSLPLRETLENYDEIAAALRDGPFAYCLEDEPAYRSGGAPAPAMPRGHVVRVVRRLGSRCLAQRDWSGPDPFCTTFYRTRPSWIQGSLSEDDARFLFQQVLTAGADEAVEIGTGSGFSTAVLAHGMHFRAAAGQAPHDWRVRSHDFFEQLWFDHSRQVGDAARELLSEPLLAHVEFNSPASPSMSPSDTPPTRSGSSSSTRITATRGRPSTSLRSSMCSVPEQPSSFTMSTCRESIPSPRMGRKPCIRGTQRRKGRSPMSSYRTLERSSCRTPRGRYEIS